MLQLKYKQTLKKDSSSLYHHMPETIDTQFARQQTELLSEVRLYGTKLSETFDSRLKDLFGKNLFSSQGEVQRRQ